MDESNHGSHTIVPQQDMSYLQTLWIRCTTARRRYAQPHHSRLALPMIFRLVGNLKNTKDELHTCVPSMNILPSESKTPRLSTLTMA